MSLYRRGNVTNNNIHIPVVILYEVINDDIGKSEIIFSEEEIINIYPIYQKLKPLTELSDEVKEKTYRGYRKKA